MLTLRISSQQIATIIQTTRSIAGDDVQVWLFRSLLDDTRQGGDIDLLVESAPVAGYMHDDKFPYRSFALE